MARLTRRRDFLRAAKADKQVTRGMIVQICQRPATEDNTAIRYGLTATKKIGNAVIRNRAKRRLRALARELLPKIGHGGYDYVLIARYTTIGRAFGALRNDLHTALRRQHK